MANYCRNPTGRERPWCFVMDNHVQWEYCDIPICTDNDPPECKITQQAGEYIGRKNVSHSGFACKPWEGNWRTTIPGMGALFMPAFPDYKETKDTHNLCRNPNGDGAPWCFVENRTFKKEYCDISFCEIREIKIGSKGNVYPECRLTEKGKEYVGTKDVTVTGKPCLRWETKPYGMPWDFFNQEMGYSDHFINVDAVIHKNYCRNPALYREKPWCFVSDPDIKWEYCDIPFCHNLEPPECKLTPSGGEYVGRLNTTISGFPCQHWLAQFPNDHDSVRKSLSAFPDEVDGSHNFCRNPDAKGHGPWCFIRKSYDREVWEYCDVPFCPRTEGERCDIRVSGNCMSPLECKKDVRGSMYMGTKNVTKSGYPCQLWMSVSPNDISKLDDISYILLESFPDDLHPSHNFCRNPDVDSNGPWCWNGAGTDPEWEESVVEVIDALQPVPRIQPSSFVPSLGIYAMTMELLFSRGAKPVAVIAFFFTYLHNVISIDFVAHYVAHPGKRYENITFETKEASVRICGVRCVLQTPPCYALNYRESDGSCQLVFNGKSGLVEANGFTSYVQSESMTHSEQSDSLHRASTAK
ncbi:unnamed protein product [Darwinula stevensoni]|uniref:Kringle domain-containing protein n=1 Tax=Darwinula stevensoni TaxID=69355 RepID=A0A7R8XAF5_9CRUS|nr:unnamed protein product [Darwinula stevensoni]CAG0886643.1 unnamed protein product [Darwinula stevensoni]